MGLPSRRTVLQTAAGCSLPLLAGCVSSSDDAEQSSRNATTTDSMPTSGAPTATATESKTATTNSTTTKRLDCGKMASPPNPGDADDVEARPYPDFPERLERSRVVEFVTAYERAYKHNEILARERNLTYVDVNRVSVSDAERTDAGFVVHVVVEFGWGSKRESDGETVSSVHADGGSKVSYLVGERVLKRVEPDEWEYVDPRTAAGAILRCQPETTTA